MSDALDVYLGTQKVGRLSLGAGRRLVFQYDPHWLNSDTAVPLSISLPLQEVPYEDDQARPFFANLLPESELRRNIARKLGLSERNDFALLEAVGGECAGAVSLLPNGAPLPLEGSYRQLNNAQLNKLVADLPQRPMLAGEEGIRLSLAGAQNKLPVYYDGETVSLPIGSAVSSHILKPPIDIYPQTVQNEAFCMTLAKRTRLNVPTTMVLQKDELLYLVERYDRSHGKESGIARLHQEDFCQALSIAPDSKYEKEGGPGLKDCFTLIRQHSIQPPPDMLSLVSWIIFNYLIGNADAHAKNISLLFTDKGPKLAPFYDLMSTAVYPGLTDRMAMRIGAEDRPDWILTRHWQQLSKDVEIGYKVVQQTAEHLCSELYESAQSESRQFRELYGNCETINKILEIIANRSRKLLTALTE